MGLHSWMGLWHTATLLCPSPCRARLRPQRSRRQQQAGSRTVGLHWEQGLAGRPQPGNESRQEPAPSPGPRTPSSPCQPSPPTPAPATHRPSARPCACAWGRHHRGQPRHRALHLPVLSIPSPAAHQGRGGSTLYAAESLGTRWNRQDTNHDSSAPPARAQERCHPKATQAGYATPCLCMAIFHHRTAPCRVQLLLRIPSLCPGNSPLHPMRNLSASLSQLALAGVQQLQF